METTETYIEERAARLADLRARGQKIRDAVMAKSVTADQVGGLFMDLVDLLEEYEERLSAAERSIVTYG